MTSYSAKRTIVLAVCTIGTICALLMFAKSAATVAKPHEKTLNRMFGVKRRILIYSAEHGRPPARLEDLPPLEGYGNELVDDSGRKIEFNIDDNIVALSSLGTDGLPAGTGEDQDIQRHFALRDKDGHWNDPNGEFLDETYSK